MCAFRNKNSSNYIHLHKSTFVFKRHSDSDTGIPEHLHMLVGDRNVIDVEKAQ